MNAPTVRDNRGELIAAAERLFAERGIDGVSLNEINRTAGQRNASALQYHFGDRNGLLRALIDKHNPSVDSRRAVLLQQYQDAGTQDLRSLAVALVLPLATKLSDPDGGRDFLRIIAELLSRGELRLDLAWGPDSGSSILVWRKLVDPLLAPESTRILHTRFTTIRFCHAELAARASARPRRDDRLFTSRLVDLVTALLATPVSPETTHLLAERRRPI